METLWFLRPYVKKKERKKERSFQAHLNKQYNVKIINKPIINKTSLFKFDDTEDILYLLNILTYINEDLDQ